ncbi:MAG: nuclear transport factor 2 family protein [Acidobacteriota bacterium]|nr:nuclear transport factor 2 family protein [Acidobacteriota bacterium]
MFTLMLFVLLPALALGSSAQPAVSDTLETFASQVEAAQRELVQGRVEPFKALWSRSADVTLTGGLGGAIEKGWERVCLRLDWVGSQYREGTRTHEEVARGEGQDFGYIVQRETIRFKAADGSLQVQELRTTMIFRREKSGWRIVHRHADAATAKHPLR